MIENFHKNEWEKSPKPIQLFSANEYDFIGKLKKLYS